MSDLYFDPHRRKDGWRDAYLTIARRARMEQAAERKAKVEAEKIVRIDHRRREESEWRQRRA